MRLSIQLVTLYKISRREAKEAIKNGLVKVNDNITTKDIDVLVSDTITLSQDDKMLEFNIDDYVLSKHNDIIFLYKPPFMHYERLRKSDELTMSDIVDTLDNYVGLSRLDYEVDGVIACVKAGYNITKLKKKYLAIVSGDFPAIVDVAWSIDANKRKSVQVIKDNKGNHTIMRKIKYNGKYSLIEVEVEKAARHQVRAFCAASGHAILGDRLYGGDDFHRLCLHCYEYHVNNYIETANEYTNKFINLLDNKELLHDK